MLRPGSELETILQMLIGEHRKLLSALDGQQAAMKALDLKRMDEAMKAQESGRLRIAAIETKRRQLVMQIARAHRLDGKVTIEQLAKLDPQRGPQLMKLRAELRELIQQVLNRSHIAGRVAGAVLGHLNTVVRLLAGAVERAGIYTKQGVPQVSARIGVMEAVG